MHVYSMYMYIVRYIVVSVYLYELCTIFRPPLVSQKSKEVGIVMHTYIIILIPASV